jgi:hypothetical protein
MCCWAVCGSRRPIVLGVHCWPIHAHGWLLVLLGVWRRHLRAVYILHGVHAVPCWDVLQRGGQLLRRVRCREVVPRWVHCSNRVCQLWGGTVQPWVCCVLCLCSRHLLPSWCRILHSLQRRDVLSCCWCRELHGLSCWNYLFIWCYHLHRVCSGHHICHQWLHIVHGMPGRHRCCLWQFLLLTVFSRHVCSRQLRHVYGVLCGIVLWCRGNFVLGLQCGDVRCRWVIVVHSMPGGHICTRQLGYLHPVWGRNLLCIFRRHIVHFMRRRHS